MAKVLLRACPSLLSSLKLETIRRNTLAWTICTRSGARGLLVNSVACAVAVRVVDDAGVDKGDAELTRNDTVHTRGRNLGKSFFTSMLIPSLIIQA